MSAPNGSVGSQSGGWNCWPPQTGGCGQGVQGGCATYHQGLKTGVCQGWGGGGGAAAHITAATGRRGASKGAMRDAAGGGGGGGGRMGQTPWRHPRGGVRRDKHAGGIPGGERGANTMAASPRGGGGGGTNTLVQPHYPNPTKSVNPAGARGGKARDNNQGETGGGDSKEM